MVRIAFGDDSKRFAVDCGENFSHLFVMVRVAYVDDSLRMIVCMLLSIMVVVRIWLW